MKKNKSKNAGLARWFFWLALVILWNYGYPAATPFEDVIVAIFLSLMLNLLNTIKAK
jgi:hypothetical protein